MPPLAADSSSHFSDQLSRNLPQEKAAHSTQGSGLNLKAMTINMKASIMYLDVGYKTVYSDLNYGKLTGSKEYLMKSGCYLFTLKVVLGQTCHSLARVCS